MKLPSAEELTEKIGSQISAVTGAVLYLDWITQLILADRNAVLEATRGIAVDSVKAGEGRARRHYRDGWNDACVHIMGAIRALKSQP